MTMIIATFAAIAAFVVNAFRNERFGIGDYIKDEQIDLALPFVDFPEAGT